MVSFHPRNGFNSNIVLKKISYYVKNIIFNHEWVSRTKILEQIFALDNQSLNNNFNSTIRANLKRRVYDSINVMVASGIILKKSSVEHYKKEYYYKPAAEICKFNLKCYLFIPQSINIF